MRIGSRVPYRHPTSGVWHSGTVAAVRATPNPADTRVFVRLTMTCSRPDVEVIEAVLQLLLKASVPMPERLCRGCWRDGVADDAALGSPDDAVQIDNWREALARQGDTVWFCPSCRSHAVTLSDVCPTCGATGLEQADIRDMKHDEDAV